MDKILDDRINMQNLMERVDKSREMKNALLALYGSEEAIPPLQKQLHDLIKDLMTALEQQKEREGKFVEALKYINDDTHIYDNGMEGVQDYHNYEEQVDAYKRIAKATLKELGIL